MDSEGAAIPRASVVLAEQANPDVHYEMTTISSGDFSFASVAPGIYTLTIESPGFLDRTTSDIRVTSGETHDLKYVTLKIAGCFAPGAMCDTFGGPPLVHQDATVDVPYRCGVDADGGKTICTASNSAVDFRVRAGDDGEIYLAAAKGASMALDTLGQWSLSDCVNAAYSTSEVRVDQLKHNFRVCVHTNGGRYAEVYGIRKLDGGNGVRMTYITWPGKSDPH
jgi:hypothetical protein